MEEHDDGSAGVVLIADDLVVHPQEIIEVVTFLAGSNTLSGESPLRRKRIALKAQVKGGRPILDEPIDLPEGTEVELTLVEDDELDPEEWARLHQAIEDGAQDIERGDYDDGFEFIALLRRPGRAPPVVPDRPRELLDGGRVQQPRKRERSSGALLDLRHEPRRQKRVTAEVEEAVRGAPGRAAARRGRRGLAARARPTLGGDPPLSRGLAACVADRTRRSEASGAAGGDQPVHPRRPPAALGRRQEPQVGECVGSFPSSWTSREAWAATWAMAAGSRAPRRLASSRGRAQRTATAPGTGTTES
jgi:hypothetical protein